VITVLNEEPSVAALLESLLTQTEKPYEMIFVDGGSDDKTVDIIKRYQSISKNIKLFEFNTSRSQARNIGIRASGGDVIVTTDAGCIADKNWYKRITKPFDDASVDLVAGFYEMIGGKSSFRKALSVFLGIPPSKFSSSFVASARSLAFRKTLWQKVGGFPEDIKDTAEDTLFNYKIIKTGAKIVRVKNAIVYWKLPTSFSEAIKKIYLYAKGDAMSGIWWHPVKKLSTHNIKVSLVFLRYIVGLYLLLATIIWQVLEFPFVLLFVFYCFWAFRKVYFETHDAKAGLCGIGLQFASDIAVMAGFFSGIISV